MCLEFVGCYMLFSGRQISKFVAAALLSGACAAHAVRMDETTHDQVIRRLVLGVETLEHDDPARPGVQLRLADLYADRARLKAMNEMDKGCTGKDGQCVAGKDDREKSIGLYYEALPASPKEKQGRIILQIAHLHALNEQSDKSVQLYKKILNAKRDVYASEVRAIANSSLGEIEFRKGEFKTALKYFEAARRENLKNRALVEYRLAWCHLNLGSNDKAIKTMVNLLRDPELLSTQSTNGKTVDPSFVQDASRDLAKFLAHAEVGPRQISLLRDLSPDKYRKDNLYTLGRETDRLGNKRASLVVWAAYVDEGDVHPNEKLEVQIRVTKIFYDMNKLDLAANAYEKSAALWKQYGCKNNEELCTELKSRMKAMVAAWNKAQKKKPTTGLFRVYVAYNSVFTDDAEMLQWGAVVGRDLGRHREAATLFHRSSEQALVTLKKKPDDKDARQLLEGSLLGEIEMAESSKDLMAKEKAYSFYLNVNPNGPEAVRVRYQRAQVFYAMNRQQDAFSEFHYLATMPGKEHRDLKVKSADLALDSLVALKDDKSLEVRSLEYARIFPERKKEFVKISRNATMNIVAANLKNEKKNDRADYAAALVALDKVSLEGADDAEKIKFYKNKLNVAQKAMDLTAVSAAAAKLLAIKSLSKEDEEWTMAQKVWVAELQLDFAQAYKLSKQMNLSHLSSSYRHLRLALLAELAGLPSRKHNEDYIRSTSNLRSANLVRITLIKESANPWKELDKHLRALKQTPELLAGVALDTYARRRDEARARRLLTTTRIAQFPAGATLARNLWIGEFNKFDRKIAAHRIYGYSEASMQKTLKERLNLIGQADVQAQQAFRNHDWTQQVLTLSVLARENRRMYRDINSLPVPRRLNAQQRAEYQSLIKSQSDPYLARAEKLEAELDTMWNDSNSVQNLQAAYMTATPELQKMYRTEIGPLAKNAPSRAANRLQNLLNTPYRRPSQKDILFARRELREDPFDISKAQSLRQLESQAGRPAMVVFLDERINQIKKGQTL